MLSHRFISIVLIFFGICFFSMQDRVEAQSQSFDVTNFSPPTDVYGLITMDSTKIYKQYRFGFGLYFNFMAKSLEMNELGPDGKMHSRDLVGSRFKGNLTGAIAFCKYYELGLDLPFVLYQDGEDLFNIDSGPSTAALGDIRMHNKFIALNREEWPVGLAAMVTLVFPSGDESSYSGNNKVGAEFKAIVDQQVGPVLIVGHLGYRIRDEEFILRSVDPTGQELFKQEIDDELFYAIGAQYFTPIENLSVLSEFRGYTLAEKPFDQRFNNPIFWDAGVRYVGPYDLVFQGGLEVSLTPGYGAGPAGFFLSMAWSWDRPDGDKDGLPDEEDKCPEEPEDEDGFEDEDGCPDTDNDDDGILDADDACPDDAEDKDDYRDEDGCPEPDNDDDGILDSADKCPNAAEDFDSDEDEDGCPDYDTDADGIGDLKDECPFDAEDFDKFEDEDGCPEPDNDKDGLPDSEDKCPLVAEDNDGFEDLDGCPDPDNDHDGVKDTTDMCPMEPETINGNTDADGCPDEGEVVVIDQIDHLEIKKPVEFEEGMSMLKRGSFALLDQIAQVLKAHGEYAKVIIEAHTDNRGEAETLRQLTVARAANVKNYLIGRGLPSEKMESSGFGPDQPKDSNRTRRGRAANNRIEVKIIPVEQQTPTMPDIPLVPITQ